MNFIVLRGALRLRNIKRSAIYEPLCFSILFHFLLIQPPTRRFVTVRRNKLFLRSCYHLSGSEDIRTGTVGDKMTNKNRINGPSYHAQWAIKYRRKYLLVASSSHPWNLLSTTSIILDNLRWNKGRRMDTIPVSPRSRFPNKSYDAN